MTTIDAIAVIALLVTIVGALAAALALPQRSHRRGLIVALAAVIVVGLGMTMWFSRPPVRTQPAPIEPPAAQPQQQPSTVTRTEAAVGPAPAPASEPVPATVTETVATPATVTETVAAPAPQPPRNHDKVFLSGLEFGKPSCAQRADRVRCVFRVTNLTERAQRLELELTNISGSSWFSYLIDAEGMKSLPIEAEIGGMQQHLWQKERLDPGVPIQAAVTFETPNQARAPLAITISVRIEDADSPQLGRPQTVSFKDLALE